jgi:hypothetical protein
MQINQGIAMQNMGMMARDVAHATHIGSQCVYRIDRAGGSQAILPAAQIKQQKFISGTG